MNATATIPNTPHFPWCTHHVSDPLERHEWCASRASTGDLIVEVVESNSRRGGFGIDLWGGSPSQITPEQARAFAAQLIQVADALGSAT